MSLGAPLTRHPLGTAAACRFVIGGTCDSVGVGGCWQGGCYGTLSRLYGAAAANLLEARVVLANGSLVVANAGSHPVRQWPRDV